MSPTRYVLVMISPDIAEVNWLSRWPSKQSEVREIRAKYKTSGLYRNNGSTEPLWTIPYHLPVYEIYVSASGQQVVIAQENWGHTISNIHSGGSVYFYDKSGTIASYQDYELTWCWILKGLANNLMGRGFAECEEAHFDSDALTYTIKTSQSEEFVFDVTTGKIIRRWSLWPFYLGVPFFGVPAALFGYYRIRLRRSHVEPAKRPGWGQFSLRGMLVFVTAVCVLLWSISFNGILVMRRPDDRFAGWRSRMGLLEDASSVVDRCDSRTVRRLLRPCGVGKTGRLRLRVAVRACFYRDVGRP